MSTVAKKLSSFSTKFQVGAAAFALAGAAALMPGAVANAAPAAPMPMASLGSALGECEPGEDYCVNPLAGAGSGASASATAEPAFCNTLACFGAGLTNADNIVVVEWNMIPLLPDALQPLFYGFWEDVIPDGFTACLFGNTAKINSYSTVTVGFTKNCSK